MALDKKIVLLIVEGPSDQDALEAVFAKIFESNAVRVHVVHEDITTKRIYKNSNIIIEINKIINQFVNDNHLKRREIQQVIHIVDMDGAYIPDSAVVLDISLDQGDEETYIMYELSTIRTNKPDSIIFRNHIKRERIDSITHVREIAKTPYQVYYMSYCLDHVLYNKLNSSDEEKDHDSTEFAIRYKDDIEGFKEFISKSSFSVQGDYLSTWDFIKQNGNSLLRYSNLWIGLNDAIEKL